MNSSVILIKIQWIDLSFFYVCFYSAFLFFWLFGPKKFPHFTNSLCYSTALFLKNVFLRLFFAIKIIIELTPLLCYVLSIQLDWEVFKKIVIEKFFSFFWNRNSGIINLTRMIYKTNIGIHIHIKNLHYLNLRVFLLVTTNCINKCIFISLSYTTYFCQNEMPGRVFRQILLVFQKPNLLKIHQLLGPI